MDKDNDNKLGYKEFEQALPILKKWGLDIQDPQKEF